MNFDPVARAYAALEAVTFGGALQSRRVAMLPSLGWCRRALLIGDGDGRFLAAFRRAFPDADIDYAEPSARMIALARARIANLPGSGVVRFIQQAVPEFFRGEGPWDLVTTHFVLDVMTEDQIATLLERVLPATTEGARWVVSDFAVIRSGRALHGASAAAIRVMYQFFGITCGIPVRRLPDHAHSFRQQGLALRNRETAWKGFLFSELWTR